MVIERFHKNDKMSKYVIHNGTVYMSARSRTIHRRIFEGRLTKYFPARRPGSQKSRNGLNPHAERDGLDRRLPQMGASQRHLAKLGATAAEAGRSCVEAKPHSQNIRSRSP